MSGYSYGTIGLYVKKVTDNTLSTKQLFRLYWFFVFFIVASLVITMLTTRDDRWMQWHLSRLGEGTELPAAFYNFSLCIVGLLAFILAYQTTKIIKARAPKVNVAPYRGIYAITLLQHFGIATFPYDRFPQIHDFFGYGLFFTCTLLLLLLKYIAPYLSKSTVRAGLLMTVLASIPMILYQYFGIGTLLVMELYGIFWMLLLIYIIARDATRMKPSDLLQ